MSSLKNQTDLPYKISFEPDYVGMWWFEIEISEMAGKISK